MKIDPGHSKIIGLHGEHYKERKWHQQNTSPLACDAGRANKCSDDKNSSEDQSCGETNPAYVGITSSENWEILLLGANMTSTFAIPPFACSVIGCSLGSKRTTPGSCNADVTGFKVTVKVNGAALLFTIGTIFFIVWPIRSAPNFTDFCRASATATWQRTTLNSQPFCDKITLSFVLQNALTYSYIIRATSK